MKTNKLKLAVGLTIALQSLSYAQSVRGKINEIFSQWLLPIFILFLVGGFLVLAVQNFDLIADKHNEGTRKKGFISIAYGLMYIFLIEIAIGAIIAILAAINISI